MLTQTIHTPISRVFAIVSAVAWFATSTIALAQPSPIENGDVSLASMESTLQSVGAPIPEPTELTLAAPPPSVSRPYSIQPSSSLFDELTFLLAVDGSKQPQDFGVNANAGGQASFNWGMPIFEELGIGLQVGSGITATSNAVRVYELLGESTGRTQSFTTIGFFQRLDSGLFWGSAYDFLYEKSFDQFWLGQWRIRGGYQLNESNQIGTTAILQSFSDNGTFGSSTSVTLAPINQGNVYWRHYWTTGAQTSLWVGIADSHGENNVVTGSSAPKESPFLFGADILMPLTASLAIYGETNMIMPTDTGTVDAFLGVQWYPGSRAFNARKGAFSPLMSLASPVSFAVDLFNNPL